MFNIGPTELILIFLVALIVVGPTRLPEIGRTIGKSLREFRRATDDFKQHLDFTVDDDEFPDEEPNGKQPSKASDQTRHADHPDDPETQP